MECWLSIRAVGINSKSFSWTAESVHKMTFIDASLPNGHAASAYSLDVTLLQIHSRGGSTIWTLRYYSASSKLIVTIIVKLIN